jgi:hypothetical protein
MKYYTEVEGGTTYWYSDAKCTIRHRDDGPAIIYANGSQSWYLNDKCHRVDGPAIVCVDGYQAWYLDGKRHRVDGPAIVCVDGYQAWYLDGKRHRVDGPAYIYANGYQEWWLNDKKYTEAQFNAKKNLTPPCVGKVVENVV